MDKCFIMQVQVESEQKTQLKYADFLLEIHKNQPQ